MTDSTSQKFRQIARSAALSGLVLASTFVFAACTTAPATPAEEQAPGMNVEKQGDTTLSGTLTKLDEKYYIQSPGKPQQEVDSYSVELDKYAGKSVTITGQFSGTTLFAGSITEQ